jgi:hypothetical protein
MQVRTLTPLNHDRTPRIGGALYLTIIALGLFQELVVRDRVIVSGNPAMTSTNLGSMESLWRMGAAAEFLLLICALCLTVILYLLLEPVSSALALLVVLFNVAAIVTEATATLYLLEGLVHLGSTGLPTTQMEAMVTTSLAMHSYGFAAALFFFGVECLVVGYLLVISGLVHRVIGLLMGLAGACYLINSFSVLVAPDLAERLFPTILIPAFIGELSLALWLLIKGVRNAAGTRPDGLDRLP